MEIIIFLRYFCFHQFQDTKPCIFSCSELLELSWHYLGVCLKQYPLESPVKLGVAMPASLLSILQFLRLANELYGTAAIRCGFLRLHVDLTSCYVTLRHSLCVCYTCLPFK